MSMFGMLCVVALQAVRLQPLKMDPPTAVRELRQAVDPAVRWTPEQVPASQNGWNLAMKAVSLCPSRSGGQAAQPTEAIFEVLEALSQTGATDLVVRAEKALKPYARVFKQLAKAAEKPRWVAPEPRNDVVPDLDAESQIPFGYAQFKEMERAMLLRARMHLLQKLPEEAASDLLLAHSIGRHLIESHHDLLAGLVGIACESLSDREIQLCARKANWSTAALKRLLSGIRAPSVGVDLAASMRHDLDVHLLRIVAGLKLDLRELAEATGIDGPTLGAILQGHPNAFDREDTMRRASRDVAIMVKLATAPWPGEWDVEGLVPADDMPLLPDSILPQSAADGAPVMPHADKPSAQEIANARRALHGVANPVGRWIIAQSSSASVLWLSNDRRSVANVLATRTVLACSIYYRLHRAEAPTLQALVDEKLVDAVPDDPFGSGPMRYDPKRRVTWSVGPDGKDTGGLDPPGRVANVGNYVWPTDGVFKR